MPQPVGTRWFRHRGDRKWVDGWSPEQIANRLKIDFPDDPSMRISHEAIYQALYIQGRGALKRELVSYLRMGRALRVPRARTRATAWAHVSEEVMIASRPAEAVGCAVPGHWGGDLIIGLDRSAIGTLPAQLWQSLTWDRDKELSDHARFTIESGVRVFFADPRSPWQRGTNETTNGLLRQYFPKGTDLARRSEREIQAVARTLNNRPRKTLGWKTPAETLDEYLESVRQSGVATTG